MNQKHSSAAHAQELGRSTAPLALSSLAQLINEVEGADLRGRFSKWARDHIRAVHINANTPLLDDTLPGLDDWDRRMLTDKVLAGMRDQISCVQWRSDDGQWMNEAFGFVLIKD